MVKGKINYNGNHRLWFKLAVYKHEFSEILLIFMIRARSLQHLLYELEINRRIMFLDVALLIVSFPPVHVYARMCACVYRQIF